MKTVLLVRHAKSSWDDFSIPDFDRPLNGRGKKNAPEMAQRLLKKGIAIDAFLSSPAKRARKTAKYFAKEYGRKKEEIILVPDLYEPTNEAFSKTIAKAPADAASLALFAHNPGITDYANQLTEVKIDNLPTSGIFAVSAEVDDWKTFHAAKKEFLFFDFPNSSSTAD